jgi:C4-dicarboxylate transporter
MKRDVTYTNNQVMDALTMLCGASVSNAGLVTLLSSADAFAARLQTANQTQQALHTLQVQALTNALVDLRAPREVRTAAAVGYAMGAQSTPPGAPVVT